MATIFSFRHSMVLWVLPTVTFCLYWVLWFCIDAPAFYDGGFSLWAIASDLLYSTLLCYVVLGVCVLWRSVFARYMGKGIVFLLVSLLSIVSATTIAVGFDRLTDLLDPYWDYNSILNIESYLICSLIACFLSAGYLSFQHFKLYKKQRKEKEQKEVALLKQQLDPHFFFNNLAILDGLIGDDNNLAHEYLARLSQVYRYLVRHSLDNSVQLNEEVLFISQYAKLLSMRYPGHFSLVVHPSLADNQTGRLVPMTLQLLLENALKHNLHDEHAPFEINISRSHDVIVVTNTYRPLPYEHPSSGQGLANLDKRYKLLFNKTISFYVHNQTFIVKVPILP